MSFFANFSRDREVLESDGVNIGGWSVKNLIKPSYQHEKPGTSCILPSLVQIWLTDLLGGWQTDSSEDRVLNAVIEQDWTDAEERRLVRKIDMRVLLPCFVIYILAYLDRSNLGNINVMQKGEPSNIQSRLGLHGTEFNWAISVTYL